MVLIYQLPISLSQYILLSPINYRDTHFSLLVAFMHTVFKVSESKFGNKFTVSIKSCYIKKKFLQNYWPVDVVVRHCYRRRRSSDIAIVAGGLRLDSLAGQIVHSYLRLAIAVTFFRSCVAQALNRRDEPRHSLLASA